MNTSRDDAEFDPFANDKSRKKSAGSSGGAAWLALLLALVVAAWNGYQWWQSQALDEAESGLQQTVSRLQSEASGLRSRLAQVESALATDEDSSLESELSALRSEFESLRSRLAASGVQDADLQAELDATNAALLLMQQRLERLENSMAALAERNAAPGRSLDVAEVGYLLRLAEERLDLFGDLRSAESALAKADARLVALEDPLYQPVRRRIAEARQALQAADIPDIPDLAARVASLQEQVPTLPFEGETPARAAAPVEQEQAGIWEKIKAALAPLVTVRRRGSDQDALSLADRDMVRQALWLELEAARLSLVRQDSAGWQQSLERALGTLKDSFDAAAAPVRTAIADVRDLRSMDLQATLPDIGSAWAQLRLLQADDSVPPAAPPAGPEQVIEQAVAGEQDGADDGEDGG